LRIVNFQVLVALGLIVLGAVEFVDAVGHLARSVGVSEVLLALVVAPIATELPETWVAGPGSYVAFLSAGIAFLASGAIFLPMARSGRLRGRGLLVGGAFYVAYLVIVLVGVTTA